eukprot:TRINITY_DN5698_c0_g1_i2.p2 TRINITY_DN5698_c0_g1~~TRINITY_DN5698_c0_g1_i2.p2  ORF type:complete len:117 (+),score=8.34 TRINITY_DN5698_c0_g1_i2:886-1236(+)
MVASTVTYPHEVVRSHMHVLGAGPFRGVVPTCRKIILADGVFGFYRGCITNLVRTTPAAAVTFTSYELISRAFRLLLQEGTLFQGQQTQVVSTGLLQQAQSYSIEQQPPKQCALKS